MHAHAAHRPHLPRRSALGLLAALPWAAATAQSTPRGELLIGRTTPLSGGMAPFMDGIHKGQEAAIADCNAAGGVNGRRIRFVTLDDGFDPKRTLANARELVEREQVLALFGVVGTSQTAAVLPYVAEQRVPLINAYTGSPAVRAQAHPTFFTTRASYADELVKIVRNLVAAESRRIGVAYENNDFGRLLQPLVQKTIAAEGAELVGAESLESSGANAADVARTLAAAKPQAVLMVAAGPPVIAFVRANRAHLGVPIYTLSLGLGTAALAALGADARGLAVARTGPFPWQATLKLTRDFQASMQRHGRPVDYDHYTGYIDARVLIEGLRAAGREPTRASVVAGMESLGRLDLGGYEFNYSPQNHHGQRFVEIAVVGPRGNYMR